MAIKRVIAGHCDPAVFPQPKSSSQLILATHSSQKVQEGYACDKVKVWLKMLNAVAKIPKQIGTVFGN